MALTVQQAVDAGISSIEHLDYAYKAGVKDEAAIAADFAAKRIDRAEANRRLDAGFDRDTAMAAYRGFAAKGVYVRPPSTAAASSTSWTRMTTPTIRTWPTLARSCRRLTSGAWNVCQGGVQSRSPSATSSTTKWQPCCRCCSRRA